MNISKNVEQEKDNSINNTNIELTINNDNQNNISKEHLVNLC